MVVVLGSETEYGALYISEEGISTKIYHYLFEGIDHLHYNVFLPNGSRYYVDTGNHPECSTPECRTARDLVRWEKANELFMLRQKRLGIKKLREKGYTGDIGIIKHNTADDIDGGQATFGYHENYLIHRKTSIDKVITQIIPFLVTRQIYTGAGNFVKNKYHMSQRARFMCYEIGDTTYNRGMISFKDEPLSNRDKYRRVHIISGDTNMSEYTTYLKLGTTALVLDMIEGGYLKDIPSIKNPIAELRGISKNLDVNKPILLDNCKRTTPIEVQRLYCDLAEKFYFREMSSKDPETLDILDKWNYILDSLAKGDFDSLSNKIDWVIKKNLLDFLIEKMGLTLGSSDPEIINKIKDLDMGYHYIDDDGFYNILKKRHKVMRIVSDEEIMFASENPPQNTRAKLRGDLVRRYPELGGIIGWSRLPLLTKKESKNLNFIFDEPLNTYPVLFDCISEEYGKLLSY